MIVQLQGGQVLSSFRKLTLLHPLPNVPLTDRTNNLMSGTLKIVPMDKGPLSIHQVKLVVKPVDLEIQTLALIKESSIFVGRYKIRNGKFVFLYIKKDKVYVLNLAHASFMAVVLERQQTALEAKILNISIQSMR